MQDDLQFGSANWREVVAKNTRKTYFVIATFLVVFFLAAAAIAAILLSSAALATKVLAFIISLVW